MVQNYDLYGILIFKRTRLSTEGRAAQTVQEQPFSPPPSRGAQSGVARSSRAASADGIPTGRSPPRRWARAQLCSSAQSAAGARRPPDTRAAGTGFERGGQGPLRAQAQGPRGLHRVPLHAGWAGRVHWRCGVVSAGRHSCTPSNTSQCSIFCWGQVQVQRRPSSARLEQRAGIV